VLTLGAAAAAWLSVLQPILVALFSAAGKSFEGWLAAKRAEQAQRDLGAAKTTNTINQESADAERRASEIAINRPDLDVVIAGMERGDDF
jgi:hypothetical protein